MSQDEEQQRRSRVVVDTPTSRREVIQSQTTRAPEQRGASTGMVAAVALAAVAITAIIFLFIMNSDDDSTNANVSVATQPTPIPTVAPILQTAPTPLPPTVIQQVPPPTATQPAPVIIQQPPAPTAANTSPPPSNVPDDTTIQSNVTRKFTDDPDLGSLDVTATVTNGRALLSGTVRTPEQKRRAERVAQSVRGIRSIDNQIIVEPSATVPE